MTDVTRGITPYSINDAHPNTRYGRPAVLPLSNTGPSQQAFFWASLDFVPAGATVISATFTFYLQRDVTAAHTFDLSQATSAWSSSITWNTRPSSTVATTASLPVSPAGTAVSFDVSTQAQAIVSGTFTDRGWRLRCTDSVGSTVPFYGAAAATLPPVLVVSYTMAPAAPDNLSPASGSVSVAAPKLTFDTDGDVVSVQVQVDPSANGTTPAFDSGEVAATGGMVNLASTSYAGLAAGASTQWRARQKNSFGWSEWSDWVTFSRTVKGTLTLASPTSGSIADGTPPVQWTYTGQTQLAWRARILDWANRIVSDSGRTSGTATSWLPPKGLTKDGQIGTLVLDVWDGVDRTATPGDPVYTEVRLALTLDLDATVGTMDTLAATSGGIQPVVTVTGTRAAGIPDEVVVYRNGEQVARMDGLDVFTGTAFTWSDWLAPMNAAATYRVAPVVNGKVAKGGPKATVTPTAQGIWLVDASDITQQVVIRGDDDQDQSAPETSIEHTPLGGAAEVVRRRLVRMPPQGTITGHLADGLGTTAATCETVLNQWASNDAGHLYWLVLGSLGATVILGDITLTQTRGPDGLGQTAVTLNWWGRA